MYKKILLIVVSILLIGGCSEIGEQLKTAVIDGLKEGLSNGGTGENSKVVTNDETFRTSSANNSIKVSRRNIDKERLRNCITENKWRPISTMALIDRCEEEVAKEGEVKGRREKTSTKKKMTKEEYINKCIQEYAEGDNDNRTKKLCKDLTTLDSVSRCGMELVIMDKAPSAFIGVQLCNGGNYKTYFLDASKRPKKGTVNSCMEYNRWRYLNSNSDLHSYCVKKINRKNSTYIN